MKIFIPFLLAGIIACQKPVVSVSPYYNLDSLLNKQVQVLGSGDFRLTKEITKEGVTELKELSPDSAMWVNEFKIIRDFNPAQSRYTSAFAVDEKEDYLAYSLKPDSKGSLKNFQMTEAGDLQQITARYEEDKNIYLQNRSLEMTLEAGVLKSINLEVLQIRFPSDSLQFGIKYTVESKL